MAGEGKSRKKGKVVKKNNDKKQIMMKKKVKKGEGSDSIMTERKKAMNKSKGAVRREKMQPLSKDLSDRFAELINVQEISCSGFPAEVWRALTFQEKMSLPAYVSSLFRQSDGTKADRLKRVEEKRKLQNLVMIHQKYGKRVFFLKNTEKIKELQSANDLTNQEAFNKVWNLLIKAVKDVDE